MSIVVILLIVALAFYLFSGNKSIGQKNTSKSDHSNPSIDRGKNKSGSYGKWVGGGLGWAFGGPIGALVGYMFGSMFDGGSSQQGGHQQYPYQSGNGTQRGDFSMSLLVLAAAVMKADGVVKKSELDYVKKFFAQNFGQEKTSQLMLVLRELLKKDINIQEVSVQIASFMDYSGRLQLLHFLFGIALADGFIDASETDTIRSISNFMRISSSDFQSVEAMFVKVTSRAYKILEISADASDDDVKKAYKKMAIKYHPDKVSHLGEDVRKAAEEKFQKMNAAFEEIKKERGIH